MELVISQAELKHLPAIKQLYQQLGYAISLDILEGKLADVTPDNQLVVILNSSQQVLGCAAFHFLAPFHITQRWCLLSALIIEESQRNQGIGRALLTYIEQYAKARGCVHLELSSNIKRIKAHQFYAQLGYTEKPKRFIKYLI